MTAVLEEIGDRRIGYSFPVGLAAMRHVLPHWEELYMLLDAGEGSKKRVADLRLIDSLEFKAGRMAGGVKRDSEMLEESATPEQTGDGQCFRKRGVELQYMFSNEKGDIVHPYVTSTRNSCPHAGNSRGQIKAKSRSQGCLEHAVGRSGINQCFEVSCGLTAQCTDANRDERVVKDRTAWPGSGAVGKSHHRASGSHAGGVFKMTESVSPMRPSLDETSS